MQTTPPPETCPACGSYVPVPVPPGAVCGRCALPLTEPVAVELRDLTGALTALDAERQRLLSRRAHLLAGLRPAAPPFGPRPVPPRTSTPRETATVDVQNMLLWLGGVLLAVAAVAFTVISWGRLGIAGRSTVLAILTLTAMGVPATLLRRSLAATAEVVACLGLVLLLLDSYAAHRTLLPGSDGTGYAAGATAVISAVWAAYAVVLRPRDERRGLRVPAHAALLLAQAPLLLWAFAAHSRYGAVCALLTVAVLDGVLMLACDRVGPRSLRPTAVAAGATAGLLGLLAATELSLRADGAGAALRAGALLLAAAVCALGIAYRLPARPGATADRTAQGPAGAGGAPDPADGGQGRSAAPQALVLGVVAGIAAVLALGGVVRTAVSGDWAVPGYLACAVVLLAVTAAAWRAGARHEAVAGTAAGLAAAHALAALWALVPLSVAMFGPIDWAGSVWTGVPAGARAAIAPGITWSHPAAVVTAVVVALVLAAAGRWHRTWALGEFNGPKPGATGQPGRADASEGTKAAGAADAVGTAAPDRALASGGEVPSGAATPPGRAVLSVAGMAFAGAAGLGVFAAAGLPTVLDAPYPVAVSFRVFLAVLLLLVAAGPAKRRAEVTRPVLGAALVVAVTAAGWALAERPTTLAVLAVLSAAFATAAVARTDAWLRAVAGSAAVVCAAGLAWAGPSAAGLPAHDASFAVLAVAAAAQWHASRTRAVPVEYAGGAAAVLALALAAGDTAVLATVLGLTGVLAGAVALRADRRPWAGYLAAVLLVAAAWVRLGASDVTVPEAYTLPVTVAALVIGRLRRRHGPAVSSWAAYGPGLAATLLPSLIAAWADAHWLRPLLLGAGALAVTLLGARHRLQALLVLGGSVLVLDALHELAPFVLQVLGVLPRWLPLAAAGAVLLAVGATYEQRLRDVRRVRDALRRLG